MTRQRLAPLRLFVGLIVLLLLQFGLLRLGLIARTYEPGAASGRQLAMAMAVGLRFDLATACLISIPVVIAAFVPWLSPGRGPRTRRAFLWTLTLVIGVLSFLLLCEFEFFREFQSRFNQLAVRYLDHPAIVGGMLWYNYPVVRYALAGVLAAAVAHVGLRGVLRWAYPVRRTDDAAEPAEPVAAPTPARERWAALAVEAGSAVLMLATVVIGVRGGFQSEPLRWGDAFKGDSEFANQMGLNGIYCLGRTLSDMATRGTTSQHWTHAADSLTDARQTVQHMVLAPAEKLLDPAGHTMLRVGDPGSRLRLKTVSGKPVNVVMVLMESFSARYVGACGAAKSYTPNFDAIAKEGTLFDHALSAGTHTHQGVFASQLGFPNLPGYESLMESSAANQEFVSGFEMFHQRGYQTTFLYNGMFAWDNMIGFFRKQGCDTFIGSPEMEADAQYVDKVWGVADHDTFARANREFDAAAKRGPFFATILTLSNHAPFQVPSVPGLPPVIDQGEMNGRLTAMQYADWSVGQFVAEAKKHDYFKDTLFVFVGDHGFHVPPVLSELHLLYHHVPLVFYAPGLVASDGKGLAGVVDGRVATHVNILPSILGLLGVTDTPQSAWGRSLFNDDFPDENFAVIKNTGGQNAVGLVRGDTMLVLYSAGGKPLLLHYTLGTTPTLSPVDDPKLLAAMETQLRAFVRTGLDDLFHHTAGPLPPVKVAQARAD